MPSIAEILQQSPLTPLDSRMLMQHVLQINHETLLMQRNQPLETQKIDAFHALAIRRLHGEPVAKIIGTKAFWKHDFKTNQHTLDPRPESELLIEQALAHPICQQPEGRILDCGTGTGCLLLSILAELPENWQGVGVDISPAALEVAKANARALKLDARTSWKCHDMRTLPAAPYDIIVSNPPYIIDNTPLPMDVQHDPALALYGGEDGLDYYRILADIWPVLSHSHSVLLMEHGQGQSKDILALFADYSTQSMHDLAGTDRTISVMHER